MWLSVSLLYEMYTLRIMAAATTCISDCGDFTLISQVVMAVYFLESRRFVKSGDVWVYGWKN